MSRERNAYTCQRCGFSLITVEEDEGATPAMIPCQVTDGCGGAMTSNHYAGEIVASLEPAGAVWRFPTPEEYAELHPAIQDHVDEGGLCLFKAKSN